MTSWQLIADVGGSNARFAKSPGHHTLDARRDYRMKDFPSFYAVLDAFLAETGGPEGCTGGAIGAAGPVDDNKVQLTNSPCTIDAAEVSARLGGVPVKLVNDLRAVALALPYLSGGELIPVGDAERDTAHRHTMLAINVGTGFGGASAIPVGSGWATNPGEPGHMALGALDTAQLELIEGARSVEDLLSGRGVVRLYNRIADQLGGPRADDPSGASIFASADRDRAAQETVRHFSALLGRIAGDLVLAMAAWGGVYFYGSVVKGWLASGGGQYFRAPFEDKGVMSERMKDVYSGLITHDNAALIGLTYLSDGV